MQTTQDVRPGAGMVVLHEIRRYPRGLAKNPSIIAFLKETALVTEHPRLEQNDIGDFGVHRLHW